MKIILITLAVLITAVGGGYAYVTHTTSAPALQTEVLVSTTTSSKNSANGTSTQHTSYSLPAPHLATPDEKLKIIAAFQMYEAPYKTTNISSMREQLKMDVRPEVQSVVDKTSDSQVLEDVQRIVDVAELHIKDMRDTTTIVEIEYSDSTHVKAHVTVTEYINDYYFSIQQNGNWKFDMTR